jgi:hypothetical protein
VREGASSAASSSRSVMNCVRSPALSASLPVADASPRSLSGGRVLGGVLGCAAGRLSGDAPGEFAFPSCDCCSLPSTRSSNSAMRRRSCAMRACAFGSISRSASSASRRNSRRRSFRAASALRMRRRAALSCSLSAKFSRLSRAFVACSEARRACISANCCCAAARAALGAREAGGLGPSRLGPSGAEMPVRRPSRATSRASASSCI